MINETITESIAEVVNIHLSIQVGGTLAIACPQLDLLVQQQGQMIAQLVTLTEAVTTMSQTTNTLDQEIADLTQKVQADTDATNSAVTMLNGIAGQIQAAVQEALAAGATQQELQAVTDAANAIQANAQNLAAAVTANTPTTGQQPAAAQPTSTAGRQPTPAAPGKP